MNFISEAKESGFVEFDEEFLLSALRSYLKKENYICWPEDPNKLEIQYDVDERMIRIEWSNFYY